MWPIPISRITRDELVSKQILTILVTHAGGTQPVPERRSQERDAEAASASVAFSIARHRF